MKYEVLASTKPEYELPINEARTFSGKMAGICYMPDNVETLFSEPEEKSNKRANGTETSGHHSVFGHVKYNFAFEGVPKIMAMILNNEKEYDTSEKSARYTKMEPSEEEKALYEKWIRIFEKEILKLYTEMDEKKAHKLAMENARYLISVFTPATTMCYTTSLRQMNYLVHWAKDFVEKTEETDFNKLLKPVLGEFSTMMSKYCQEKMPDGKSRTFSLFSNVERQEEWGENYCCNYVATFAQVAQAQRHRTISYEIKVPNIEDAKFFVPPIIRLTDFEKEWLKDIKSLAYRYPQGMLVRVNERGTVENFVLKCKERLCGCAQLEIAMQTMETMIKYLENTKETNQRVYEYLLPYSKGARCTFPDYKCPKKCDWGPKGAFRRLV